MGRIEDAYDETSVKIATHVDRCQSFVAASSAGGTSTNAGGSNLPPLSGGGKAGFIASWKTATQLTSSKLFQSTAGNLGIGTTKPAANFDINGTEIVRNTLTLFPNGSAPTLTVNGTAFNVSNTGLVSFVSGQTFPGTGTITGVGTASGSGLMGGGTSGTLNLSLTNACSSGQVLSWSGSGWVCSTISGGGTITGVTAGTDLTGGGSSGNVTLNLDTSKVPELGAKNNFQATQTVGVGDLAISAGNLNLPQTTSATKGVVTLGGAPFISACCSSTSFNTFVGTNAGNFNTQTSDNTAFGYQALTNNTGNTNTAIGGTALTTNTSGNSNTAVGTSSLQVNTRGGSNTAVGAGALESNGLGSWNTAVGSGAGHSNTGGSNNTFVGQAADAGSQNLTNATAIGSAAIVGESNALVLGAPGVNVGINTPTPAYALDVHGTGNFTGAVAFSSSQTFPNTISGVTTAAGSGLTGGGTSGTLNLGLLNTCSSGQVLTWSGSAWVCTGLSGGGTITGVTAGTDLTGGGTSGNVTLSLDTTKVPQLNAANSFTGNQTVNGNLTVVNNNSYQPFWVQSSSTFGTWLELGNTSTGGHTWTILSAASGNAEGAGNLGITDLTGTSTIWLEGNVNTGNLNVNNGTLQIGTTSTSAMLNAVASSGSFTGISSNGYSGTGAPTDGIYGTGGSSLDYYGATGVMGVGGTSDHNPPGAGGVFVGGNRTSSSGSAGDGVDAVVGKSNGQPSGLAGYFFGDVDVTGALSAGTKDFKIDHPLDPANKYLVHASVESSEMKNIYDGNVTTDSQGHATVQLPEWFGVLNTDFRYQLTVIGQFAQAIVARKIENDRFEIRTSAPNVEVSWQVTGVRQDAFAKAHPLVVEQQKDAGLRGYYIHPELYGVSEEKGIEWARHPEIMQRLKDRETKRLDRIGNPAGVTAPKTTQLNPPTRR